MRVVAEYTWIIDFISRKLLFIFNTEESAMLMCIVSITDIYIVYVQYLSMIFGECLQLYLALIIWVEYLLHTGVLTVTEK